MNLASRWALLVAFALPLGLVGGCASLSSSEYRREAADEATRACLAWYGSLDAIVDASGVRDAQAARIAGFPYLRVDRFSASLAASGHDRPFDLEDLVARMRNLDKEARTAEIANLSSGQVRDALGTSDKAVVADRTSECAQLLTRWDLAHPQLREDLFSRLHVPDDYVDGLRVAGLYPLSKIPFAAGVRRLHEEVKAAFERDLDSRAHMVVRYSPETRPRVSPDYLRVVLERSSENALGVPEPPPGLLESLFALYAPSFEVETRGDYDRPGALRWRWGPVPEVDPADPVVYRSVAHTRYRGRNLLQLVYTIWFPERPALVEHDLLAGKLDGIVFRVTLAPDGTPVIYDSIHPCGCYHMFFTTPRAMPIDAPAGEPEWAFVPQKLRAMTAQDRIVIRLASGTHFIERVYRDQDDSLARYVLRPYDELRSLPRMRGGSQSVFGSDGMIAGTERDERFVFWPMGIANAGAMRQWGRHPTAFIGRRHFDDADLLERRFKLDLQ